MNLCPHKDDPTICPPCSHRKTFAGYFASPGPVREAIATFDSSCPDCDSQIMEGDVIVKYDDDEPWVCDDC